jgi:hypothetical protein
MTLLVMSCLFGLSFNVVAPAAVVVGQAERRCACDCADCVCRPSVPGSEVTIHCLSGSCLPGPAAVTKGIPTPPAGRMESVSAPITCRDGCNPEIAVEMTPATTAVRYKRGLLGRRCSRGRCR